MRARQEEVVILEMSPQDAEELMAQLDVLTEHGECPAKVADLYNGLLDLGLEPRA